jgi:orotate phosphoribosyltransferase-like protein
MKRHGNRQIVTMLQKADDLAEQGHTQAEICKNLGISVMTLHRWRKLSLPLSRTQGPADQPPSVNENGDVDQAALLDENRRLRRLLTDLLLEKARLEEIASGHGYRKRAS